MSSSCCQAVEGVQQGSLFGPGQTQNLTGKRSENEIKMAAAAKKMKINGSNEGTAKTPRGA
jgi:hypothetical protein